MALTINKHEIAITIGRVKVKGLFCLHSGIYIHNAVLNCTGWIPLDKKGLLAGCSSITSKYIANYISVIADNSTGLKATTHSAFMTSL